MFLPSGYRASQEQLSHVPQKHVYRGEDTFLCQMIHLYRIPDWNSSARSRNESHFVMSAEHKEEIHCTLIYTSQLLYTAESK